MSPTNRATDIEVHECEQVATCADCTQSTHKQPVVLSARSAKKMRINTAAAAATTKQCEIEEHTHMCLLKYEGCHGFALAGRCVYSVYFSLSSLFCFPFMNSKRRIGRRKDIPHVPFFSKDRCMQSDVLSI